MTVTVPGIYPDMDHEEYLRDPVPEGSLSASGAKTILASPAQFQWNRTHSTYSKVFDLGSAVHRKVLGVGNDLAVIESDSYRTKAAQTARDEARNKGLIPVLAKELDPINRMVESVLGLPVARRLLEQPGAPEVALFGRDPVTGEWKRGKFDILPEPGESRTIIVDLKTAVSADPREFRRNAAKLNYHMQNAWYTDLLTEVRGDTNPAFVFIIVEKTPPYLPSVCEIAPADVEIGRQRNRAAIDLWHRCRETEEWPGYGNKIHRIELPVWAAMEEETVL